MENKVLQKNCGIISSYDKELANRILMFKEEKSTSDNVYTLSTTRTGEYNILCNNIPVHNPISPVEEARNIIKNLGDEKNTIRIIFGLGLGYLADELSQKTTKSTIIVYEPSLKLLNIVLSLANIDALSQKNVILCNDKETFVRHIFNLTDENTQMSVSFVNFYKDNYKSEIEEILNLAQIEQGKKKANINTIVKKSPSVIFNTFANLKHLSSCPPIEDFKNIYKGKNALILSAGPSTGENIELIKKHKDKFIIFAVNSILKLLTENNITPDFIVDIEAYGKNPPYDNIDISNSYLILEVFSHFRKYLTKSKGKILCVSERNFLNDWIKKLFNIEGSLKTYGTVTYSAVKCAQIMGFSNIVLLGSDLAFKDGSCYTKGSVYECLECYFDENEKKYKIKTKDIKEFARSLCGKDDENCIKKAQKRLEFLNENIYTVKSIDGRLLPSQTSYVIFVKYFEELASEIKEISPETDLYNCSMGALIGGFKNILFEEAASKFAKSERIELEIKQKQFPEKLPQDINTILKHFEEVQKIVEELETESSKIINELKNKKVLTQNILKRIKKHNEALKTLLNYKTEEDFLIIFAQYNYLIIPVIEKMNIQNLEEHIQFFEELNNIYIKMERHFVNYKKVLTNSQSFIVQKLS